jgi:hypothetical protein
MRWLGASRSATGITGALGIEDDEGTPGAVGKGDRGLGASSPPRTPLARGVLCVLWGVEGKDDRRRGVALMACSMSFWTTGGLIGSVGALVLA